jgi:hypothetical protein
MGNRILPLISAIRLADIANAKLFIFWAPDAQGRFVETKHVSKWAGRTHLHTDFFENIKKTENVSNSVSEDKLFTLINKNEFNKAGRLPSCKKYFNTATTTAVVSQKDLERFNVLWFDRIWFPIALNTDQYKPFIPYPRSTTPIKPNQYIYDLRKYAKMLKMIPIIQSKVKSELTKPNGWDSPTIGVHIRSTNGGFLKKKFTHLIDTLEELLQKYPNHKIFLAADTQEREDQYKKHFKDKLITYNNPIDGQKQKRSNTISGVQNGIVDMLLLSNCDILLGTGESSFSFMAFIFGQMEQYVVHTP